jgi:hypothetical protein
MVNAMRIKRIGIMWLETHSSLDVSVFEPKQDMAELFVFAKKHTFHGFPYF